ncbi:conjugal transfer pilus assembly protein TraH [Escherichia coli]|nr:conjugal transfer pilus assembly protein TraH [Escherichia coli]
MTLAAITMTAPEAASPVQMYRATYSPDDNKLRLYAASRLDPETYKKVHDAGFRWAPKQALFVAPAWTPGREDVLLSLAGKASMKEVDRYGRPWMMTSSPRSRPAKLRSAVINGRFSISNAGLTTIRTA